MAAATGDAIISGVIAVLATLGVGLYLIFFDDPSENNAEESAQRGLSVDLLPTKAEQVRLRLNW